VKVCRVSKNANARRKEHLRYDPGRLTFSRAIFVNVQERHLNFEGIQTIDRLDHQAARKGRGQSGLPSPKVVRPCCVGFFPRPSLSYLIRLMPALSGAWRIALTKLWEGGVSLYLKSKKSVSFTFHLYILLGKLYTLAVSCVHQRFFGQESDSNVQFGGIVQKLMHYSGWRHTALD